MTAQQRAIGQQGLQGGFLAVALAGVFAVGIMTGAAGVSLLPRALALPSTSHAAAVAAPSGVSAYQSYRAGERTDLSAPSAVSAYRSYRAGEQADLSAPDSAWLNYRAGERGYPGP